MAFRILSAPPSGNVVAVSYDVDEMILLVEFKQNKIYKYTQVPENIAAGFETAVSSNQYLQAFIVGAFDYERIV